MNAMKAASKQPYGKETLSMKQRARKIGAKETKIGECGSLLTHDHENSLKQSDFHLSSVHPGLKKTAKLTGVEYKQHRALDVEPAFKLEKNIPTYHSYRDAAWTVQTGPMNPSGPPGWTNDYANHYLSSVKEYKDEEGKARKATEEEYREWVIELAARLEENHGEGWAEGRKEAAEWVRSGKAKGNELPYYAGLSHLPPKRPAKNEGFAKHDVLGGDGR